MVLLEPLFSIKMKCINCENDYQTSRVRPSFKKGSGTDSDFCVRYKEFNPDYYVVRVCPFCGFSSSENFTDKLTKAQKEEFNEKIGNNWSMKDYCNSRTWEEAMQTYKLGLLCAQIKGEKDRVVAGLLHHIAWLHREKGDVVQEKRFLEFALNAYIKVFETEGQDLNNARLMYLIGELHRRLLNFTEAVKWFTRVINDKRIMDAGMIKKCREQWITVREDMLSAKLELPEEMKEA